MTSKNEHQPRDVTPNNGGVIVWTSALGTREQAATYARSLGLIVYDRRLTARAAKRYVELEEQR